MNLKTKFKKDITKGLQESLGFKNVMQVPNIEKVVLSVGVGKSLKDSSLIDIVEESLTAIAGQKPVKTVAKKSIANFKLREGMIVGLKVTLRGDKMYDFIEKFIAVTLPRVRDFRGISKKSVDKTGNLSIGIRENIAFPEIKADAIEKMHGIEVTMTTTATNKKDGLALLEAIGIPFKK